MPTSYVQYIHYDHIMYMLYTYMHMLQSHIYTHTYICIHVCIHIHIKTHIHMHIHIHIRLKHVCAHTNVYIYTYINTYAYTHTHIPGFFRKKTAILSQSLRRNLHALFPPIQCCYIALLGSENTAISVRMPACIGQQH